MPQEPSQVQVWSHFQTQRPESFAQAANRLRWLLRLCERLCGGRSLLNVGCGNGFLEQTALASGWNVLSVDPDQKSVERLRSLGIEARCGTIESIPAPSQSVDAVVCSEVLEHLKDDSLIKGLEEIHRVLVPGGVLVGTVPYRENLLDNEVVCPHCGQVFHRWGHYQSFDQARIRSLLSGCFLVFKISPSYFPVWSALNWKGKLLASIQCGLSLFGVYGSNANLVFIGFKN